MTLPKLAEGVRDVRFGVSVTGIEVSFSFIQSARPPCPHISAAAFPTCQILIHLSFIHSADPPFPHISAAVFPIC